MIPVGIIPYDQVSVYKYVSIHDKELVEDRTEVDKLFTRITYNNKRAEEDMKKIMLKNNKQEQFQIKLQAMIKALISAKGDLEVHKDLLNMVLKAKLFHIVSDVKHTPSMIQHVVDDTNNSEIYAGSNLNDLFIANYLPLYSKRAQLTQIIIQLQSEADKLVATIHHDIRYYNTLKCINRFFPLINYRKETNLNNNYFIDVSFNSLSFPLRNMFDYIEISKDSPPGMGSYILGTPSELKSRRVRIAFHMVSGNFYNNITFLNSNYSCNMYMYLEKIYGAIPIVYHLKCMQYTQFVENMYQLLTSQLRALGGQPKLQKDNYKIMQNCIHYNPSLTPSNVGIIIMLNEQDQVQEYESGLCDATSPLVFKLRSEVLKLIKLQSLSQHEAIHSTFYTSNSVTRTKFKPDPTATSNNLLAHVELYLFQSEFNKIAKTHLDEFKRDAIYCHVSYSRNYSRTRNRYEYYQITLETPSSVSTSFKLLADNRLSLNKVTIMDPRGVSVLVNLCDLNKLLWAIYRHYLFSIITSTLMKYNLGTYPGLISCKDCYTVVSGKYRKSVSIFLRCKWCPEDSMVNQTAGQLYYSSVDSQAEYREFNLLPGKTTTDKLFFLQLSLIQ